jgi:putative spermidine/putrescine transport system permease protein
VAVPQVPPPRARRRLAGWLITPAVLLLIVVFAYPLVILLSRSVTESTPNWYSTYAEVISDPVTVKVLWRTIVMATIVTTVTLLLGYPYAYLMSRVGSTWRGILIALVLVPFWTSLMSRTFAWYILLQDTGVINQMLGLVHLGPFSLIRSTTGVTIGMAQVLLPFMVLPLYSTMSRIEPRLTDAAISLGAPPRTAWRRVYLPLSMPGVVAGTTLVFILALGFFITPKILGSPKESMISQLIDQQVSRLTNFGAGGALSLLLLLVTGLLLLLMSRVVPPSEALGVGGAEE